MAAGLLNIPLTVTNNADWPRRATLQLTGGVAMNLTGSTHELTIRRTPEHPERLIYLTEGQGITTNQAAGTIDFDWSRAGLGKLGPGVYHYDVRRLVGDRKLFAWSGTFTVQQGVSRDE